ncbi:MAG TPA: DUF5996 family protein [Thermoanaerobaculia bacterium]|nr:DUF5996 family protein [Thermoanaerobaculia bacterium]
MTAAVETWPPLKYDDWAPTAQTLQMWTQIVGKIRMAKSPPINHWWHVALYVTSRGLGTSPILNGAATFEMEFDFIDHRLRITTSDGASREIMLQPMTVAAFYERVMAALAELHVSVEINPMPCEVAEPISFPLDTKHHSYDAAAAARFWRVLVDTCRVFSRFRSDFLGKVSPIHFFWGGIDLAMTRFSGREAPLHAPTPGIPLHVVREAYSHEVSSAGFWPGGAGFDAAFYSYAYPEPEGYGRAHVGPAAAFYSPDLREFLLPYEAVRTSASPDDALMEFLQSTYGAAANLGKWDRDALERRLASSS